MRKVINEQARKFGKKVIASLNRDTILMNEIMEGK